MSGLCSPVPELQEVIRTLRRTCDVARTLEAEKKKEEELRKIKTLGAAADDVDDVSAWASKSRALEEKAKAEARAKALKAARALEEQVQHPSASP